MLEVAVQMDPLEKINFAGDSTFAMMLEAKRRGHRLWFYTPDHLSLGGRRRHRARARDRRLRRPGALLRARRDASSSISRSVDVVLLRQDPPFDLAYITSTHFLERVAARALVVNDPAHVRNAPEKLFVMEFADLMPPTLITRDRAAIERFRAEHGEVVMKPLYRPWRRQRVQSRAARSEFRLAVRSVPDDLPRALGRAAFPAGGVAGRQAHPARRRARRSARSTACRRRTTFAPIWCAAAPRRPPNSPTASGKFARGSGRHLQAARPAFRRHRRDRRLADGDQRHLADGSARAKTHRRAGSCAADLRHDRGAALNPCATGSRSDMAELNVSPSRAFRALDAPSPERRRGLRAEMLERIGERLRLRPRRRSRCRAAVVEMLRAALDARPRRRQGAARSGRRADSPARAFCRSLKTS